jgi:integrase
VKSRPDGFLFADSTGVLRRTNSAEHLSKWIRTLGIKDHRVAPVHSFRHRFKTIARAAGIGREYHHAITGHREGMTRGDNYGEVPLPALYREILKLPWINIGQASEA